MGACRLLSRCRTDVCDDCAVPRLFVDIVKLPLKDAKEPVHVQCLLVILVVVKNPTSIANLNIFESTVFRHCVIRCGSGRFVVIEN